MQKLSMLSLVFLALLASRANASDAPMTDSGCSLSSGVCASLGERFDLWSARAGGGYGGGSGGGFGNGPGSGSPSIPTGGSSSGSGS